MLAPRIQPTIQTVTGRMFPLLAPRPSDIAIEDVAHALSNLCRFTGHTREFYSVAQHSVLVSFLVPSEDALAALLHDASEAYIADINKPLKPHLTNYEAIETRVMEAVLAAFGLPTCIPAAVKRADLVALATERRDLMPESDEVWECLIGVLPDPVRIRPLPPRLACGQFMDRFADLRRAACSA